MYVIYFCSGYRSKFDHCVIDDRMKALQEQEHRAAAVIETIVVSYPFQHRYFKAAKKIQIRIRELAKLENWHDCDNMRKTAESLFGSIF